MKRGFRERGCGDRRHSVLDEKQMERKKRLKEHDTQFSEGSRGGKD